EPSADQPLSGREQARTLFAVSSATSDMPGLESALSRGLDAGLSVSESREILVQLYAYVGFPRSLNALGTLMNVVEERRRGGIQDAAGREPGRAVPAGEALLAAGKANQ